MQSDTLFYFTVTQGTQCLNAETYGCGYHRWAAPYSLMNVLLDKQDVVLQQRCKMDINVWLLLLFLFQFQASFVLAHSASK